MNYLLALLAKTYAAGAKLREQAFRRGWLQSRKLAHPVVSIGNLTVGGTGKTPLAAWVAECMARRGYKPAILTRGYRRQGGSGLVAIEPGSQRSPSPRSVGDEPAWLARTVPQVPIVISANRYRAGQLAEARFGVDLHILDDGFQHFALQRDLDIVTLDVTQELSDDAVLPAGRLRESCRALGRADIVLLTRVHLGDAELAERRVRAINPRARIFRCSTMLQGLIGAASGELQPISSYHGSRVCAFCGIGNPGAFFADLRRWGFDVGAEFAFRDHWVYGRRDLQRLNAAARTAGTVAFVTTEKDLMNLNPQWSWERPVLACRIRLEISDAPLLEDAVMAGLAARTVRAIA